MSSSASGDGRRLPHDVGWRLPHDVTVEILKRLPVGSLLRFRCVCQSWRSTIDDRRFVALHLNHSALDASNWHVAWIEWGDPHRSMCFLFSGESLLLSRIEVPFAAPSSRYGFVGSCNGLICVTRVSKDGYGRSMYLWNLFTRKHKEVRRSCPDREFLSKGTSLMVQGFGFDARSNDYKIVRILDHAYEYRHFVEIYSLNTDSWRNLECEVPAFCRSGSEVFLNGNLHWFAFKANGLSDQHIYGSIVLFDVADEVFDEMALPKEACHRSLGLELYLAVFNDLLAVLTTFVDAIVDPCSVCSVWVMREYGVPESWTKLYTFKACGLVAGFHGITRNGKLLMEINTGERVSWNPITGQYANLPLSISSDLVTVVESLVSL